MEKQKNDWINIEREEVEDLRKRCIDIIKSSPEIFINGKDYTGLDLVKNYNIQKSFMVLKYALDDILILMPHIKPEQSTILDFPTEIIQLT